MRLLSLALLTAALACDNPRQVRPDQDFTLTMGETVQVQGTGFGVTFVSVPTDTRCPINAQCVEAGNAQVELAIDFGPPGALTPDLLLVLNTTVDPHAMRVGGYLVQLEALDPQPVAGQPRKQPYRVTLRAITTGAVP
jgi:hypothetical protein